MSTFWLQFLSFYTSKLIILVNIIITFLNWQSKWLWHRISLSSGLYSTLIIDSLIPFDFPHSPKTYHIIKDLKLKYNSTHYFTSVSNLKVSCLEKLVNHNIQLDGQSYNLKLEAHPNTRIIPETKSILYSYTLFICKFGKGFAQQKSMWKSQLQMLIVPNYNVLACKMSPWFTKHKQYDNFFPVGKQFPDLSLERKIGAKGKKAWEGDN